MSNFHRFCEFGSSPNIILQNNQQTTNTSMNEQQTVGYWCNMGNEFHRQNRFEESLQCYRNAIALDPQDCSLFFNIGDTYARLMQLDDAVKYLELSVTLSHFENMRYVSRLIDVFEISSAPSKYSQSIQSLSHQLATHVSFSQDDVSRQAHRLNRLCNSFYCSTKPPIVNQNNNRLRISHAMVTDLSKYSNLMHTNYNNDIVPDGQQNTNFQNFQQPQLQLQTMINSQQQQQQQQQFQTTPSSSTTTASVNNCKRKFDSEFSYSDPTTVPILLVNDSSKRQKF